MEGVKVRAFKDGNDFVLYFEDINPDMEEFLKNMLNPLLESDSLLEHPQKEDDDPVIPHGGGRYTGKRVSDILTEEGNKGYANIVFLKDTLKLFNTRDTMSVNEILDRYLVDNFSGVDPYEYAGGLSEEAADEWIKCFDSLITTELKTKVKNLTGFSSYEDFIKDGSHEQKLSLIYNVINNMGFSH